jgi:hypothetical protein
MKQGMANRDVKESRAVDHPRARAVGPGGAGQLGNMQGSHVTRGEESDYRGDPLYIGKGYEPPVGPSQASGVGGGRKLYPAGSQRRS